MRTELVIAGITGLWLGAAVEVAGLIYATDAITHNLYGWAGGFLIVLGLIALGTGRARKPLPGR